MNWKKNLEGFWEKRGSLFKWVGVYVLGVFSGVLAPAMLSHLETNREQLATEVQEVEFAANSVEQALQVFIQQLNGQTSADQEDRMQLQQALVALSQEVSDTTRHASDLDPSATEYINSMVSLRSAAMEFHDAFIGGREFVEALENYQVSRERFETAATRERRRFRVT